MTPIPLVELEPEFIRYRTERADPTPRRFRVTVKTAAEAQGIQFLCPVCFQKNGGAVGTHLVEVTFAGRGAGDDEGSHGTSGQPSRWTIEGGNTFASLTLSPSIDLVDGCAWHGFVRAGLVT